MKVIFGFASIFPVLIDIKERDQRKSPYDELITSGLENISLWKRSVVLFASEVYLRTVKSTLEHRRAR